MVNDLRYAARLLGRNPGFAASAILTLTLGIGMTTAIFSVVRAVLLRPVPFPELERLVLMWETDRNSGTTREPASLPDFVDYRQRSRRLDRVGTFTPSEMDLQPDRGDSQRLAVLAMTPDLVPVLGMTTIAGRPFTDADVRPGGPPVALISDRLWDAQFARDGSAIGRTIRLNGVPRTIVGVVGPTADLGVLQILSAAAYARFFADRDPRARVDVWLGLHPDPAAPGVTRGGNHVFYMVGRLAPGATVASAHEEMTRIAADLEREYPQDNAGRGAYVERLDDLVFGRTRTALTVLMVAVSLVLIICCVNVANLLLVRATSRIREVAVRAALGAELPRLTRQFAVENVLLTTAAAAIGVPLAYGVLRVLVAVGPADIPRLTTVSLDGTVLLAAVAMSAAIGLLFGVLPVRQARRADLQSALKAEDRRAAAKDRDAGALRSALVVAEVALAVVLVTGAGLLIRTFSNLSRTDPGFDVTGVVKAQFGLPVSRYPFAPQSAAIAAYSGFSDRLLQRVATAPGVESAGLAAFHPLETGFTQSFRVVGRESERESWPELSVRHVTPGYFPTLRVPLVSGRLLTAEDKAGSTPVVVINEATADQFFAGRNPIGQRITFWGGNWTIVGVVGNERFHGVDKAPPIGAYASLAQTRMRPLSLMVRTNVPAAAALPAVRSAIRDIDPQLAVFGVEALEDTLAGTLAEQRFMMLLLGLFGLLAIVLAAIGVYGVLTYLVAQRTREIGVRMALGATAGSVIDLVVRQGMRLVTIGLVAGFALALVLGRSMSGLLFGVAPTDLVTLGGVIVVLAVVAAVAIWLPARRAVLIDPLTALHQE